MKFVSILLLFGLFLRDATCLASSSSDHRAPTTRVISIKKNGGEAKIFDLNLPDTNQTTILKRKLPSLRTFHFSRLRQKAVSALRSTFLPSGYPARTPPGYLRYCMCSWVQDLSTQLRSVLATQRVLEGVGVGREGATALSALMNYLVRDGCGMAATLLFTSAASSKFRSDVKRWRLFADIILDFGITLEVMALLVPKAFFLPMISVGNMCKAVCGVAAGACGGSINLHWAKGSDISDINAKFGAQHTVTGALGLIFAAFFARSVDHINAVILWTLYASLTLMHILSNAWCMRLIAFDACNTARMNMLLKEFFAWWDIHGSMENPGIPALSTPEALARSEPLFFVPHKASKSSGGVPIRVGVSFDEFWEATGGGHTSLQQLRVSETTQENYLIAATNRNRLRAVPSILVVLLSRVSGKEEAKAYFHANWLARNLHTSKQSDGNLLLNEDRNEIEYARAWHCFDKAMDACGWDVGKTELTTDGYEVEFST